MKIYLGDIRKLVREARYKVSDPKSGRFVEIEHDDRLGAADEGEKKLGIPPFTANIEELNSSAPIVVIHDDYGGWALYVNGQYVKDGNSEYDRVPFDGPNGYLDLLGPVVDALGAQIEYVEVDSEFFEKVPERYP